MGGGILGEFSEEYLQEVLDPVFRHIALKTEEEMNLLSPDALYAGFLGALFGTGVESVDAAVKGLPVDFEFIDSTTEVPSDYAEFADLFEDLDGWEHLKTLPKAEQEAFIETLFDEDPVEAENPVTTAEILNPETEILQSEADLDVEESTERGILKERDSTKGIGIQYFAQIPKEKFTGYALNPEKDPNKAKAFKDALGYDLSNYEQLIQNINDHIDESKFVEKSDLGFGMRYQNVIELEGPNGKKANVVTAWIQDGDDKRLTSIYVTKKKVKK